LKVSAFTCIENANAQIQVRKNAKIARINFLVSPEQEEQNWEFCSQGVFVVEITEHFIMVHG
jgi:hypothetical protein